MTSKKFICLISLNNNGWGNPHTKVDKNKKKIPLNKKLLI